MRKDYGNLSAIFGKPVFIGEFGETSANGEKQQAEANLAMWRIIDKYTKEGKILGAFGFSAIDEWYKGSGSYFEHDKSGFAGFGKAEEWFGNFSMRVQENSDGTYTVYAIPKETLIWQYLEWHPGAALPAQFKAIELPNPYKDLKDTNHPFMHRVAVNTFGPLDIDTKTTATENIFEMVLSDRTAKMAGEDVHKHLQPLIQGGNIRLAPAPGGRLRWSWADE